MTINFFRQKYPVFRQRVKITAGKKLTHAVPMYSFSPNKYIRLLEYVKVLNHVTKSKETNGKLKSQFILQHRRLINTLH